MPSLFNCQANLTDFTESDRIIINPLLIHFYNIILIRIKVLKIKCKDDRSLPISPSMY